MARARDRRGRTATGAPTDMLQSGNAKYSWFWHGDPLTPGVGATADAPRSIPRHGADAAEDSRRGARRGARPRKSWRRLADRVRARRRSRARCRSPIALGPGPVAVRLDVQMDAGRRPIRNVIATIDGPRRPIAGSCCSARTTTRGASAAWIRAPARGACSRWRAGLGRWRKGGWTPRAHDRVRVLGRGGVRPGRLDRVRRGDAAELREQLVIYINTDMYMRGRFDGGGMPSLRDFLVQVTRDVPHGDRQPSTTRWRAAEWTPPARRRGAPRSGRLRGGAEAARQRRRLRRRSRITSACRRCRWSSTSRRQATARTTPTTTRARTSSGSPIRASPGRADGARARADGDAAEPGRVLPFRYSHYAAKMRRVHHAWPRAGPGGGDADRRGVAARAKATAVRDAAAALEARDRRAAARRRRRRAGRCRR